MEKQESLAGRTQEPFDETLVDLRELLRILNEYKWSIAGVAVLTLICAAMWAFTLTPIYRATATVLIEAKSNQPVREVEDVYDPGLGRSEYYGTQTQILRSHELAKRVVERLDLVNHKEFAPKPPSLLKSVLNWRRWLPFVSPKQGPALSEAEREALRKDSVARAFQSRLTVQYLPYTQLVKVNFDAEDPKLAASAANTLSDVFIESALEGRLQVAQKTSSWLTERLDHIKADLQNAEKALQAFREQEQLVAVGGERGMVESELTDSALRLREAQRTRAALASAYTRLQEANNDPAKLESVKPLLDDALVDKAKGDVIAAQVKVEQLQKRYGPKHPEMISAQAQLNAATSVFQKQLQSAAEGIKAKYEVARENERALGQFEAQARGTIRSLDRKQYQLRALEQDVANNRQLYDMFLNRFRETDISGGYEALVARIVDPAIVPRVPYEPDIRQILLIACLGGIVLGVVLAALRATLSDMVRNGEELETLVGTTIIGVLPLVPSGERKDLANFLVSKPRAGYSEGIRSIRTGVLLGDLDSKRKRLVVTSSVPGEGKTTLAINLAIAHGEIEKVLLLEGDLRRPSVAAKCGIKDSSGLVDWLAGTLPLERCIFRHQEAKIDILPVGKAPPNPAEVFASGRFHKLIDTLMERYDRIIIDSAPCHAVSDSVLLAQNCDGLIFVVHADVTGKRMLRSAIRHLRQSNIPIIGAVVNQVDMKRQGHYFASYYHEYGYYS